MSKREEVYRQLERITNLPTLPVVIQKLGKVIYNPKTDAKQVSSIIEDDPAIMARVLKVVNSAFYAAVEPVTSVQMAVARIGMVALHNIALTTAVFSSFGKEEDTDFNREQFWRHSISTGVAASLLYDRTRGSLKGRYGQDVLQLAGLLHDVGKILLEQFFHDDFRQILQLSSQDGVSMLEAEVEVLGTTHADIGGWLGEKWNLGNNVMQVIKYHHNPNEADEDIWDLVALCHMSNYICNIEKIGYSGDTEPEFIAGIWERLGLQASEIPALVDAINEEADKSEVLLSIARES